MPTVVTFVLFPVLSTIKLAAGTAATQTLSSTRLGDRLWRTAMPHLRPCGLLLSALCLAGSLAPGGTQQCKVLSEELKKSCLQNLLDEEALKRSDLDLTGWLGQIPGIPITLPDKSGMESSDQGTNNYSFTDTSVRRAGDDISTAKLTLQEVTATHVSIHFHGSLNLLILTTDAEGRYCFNYRQNSYCVDGMSGNGSVELHNLTTVLTAQFQIAEKAIDEPDTEVIYGNLGQAIAALDSNFEPVLMSKNGVNISIVARNQAKGYLAYKLGDSWFNYWPEIKQKLEYAVKEGFDKNVRPFLNELLNQHLA